MICNILFLSNVYSQLTRESAVCTTTMLHNLIYQKDLLTSQKTFQKVVFNELICFLIVYKEL